MSCTQVDTMRDLFSAALYDELNSTERRELEEHLATCDSCRRESEELQETLALMDRRSRVEPSDEQWKEFDRRLGERLSEERPLSANGRTHPAEFPVAAKAATPGGRRGPRVLRWLPSSGPAWGYGIAAVFLLAIGFFVGRTFFVDTGLVGTGERPGDVAVRTDGARVEARTPDGRSETFTATPTGPSGGAATAEALDYLERSRNLLIGLTNIDEGQAGSLDMRRQREVSRELYDTGNTLTVALSRPSQQQLRQLVQQLQIILLQLSNAGTDGGQPAVEIIREGLDSKSILLKINLEAIRASLHETADRPTDKPKTSS